MSGASNSDEYLSAEVHQATGMVSVQVSCDVSEALRRLRIRADAINHSLHETATRPRSA
jgi:hypothetical protein